MTFVGDVLPALAIAGAAASAGGQVLGGIATNNAASYQATVAANNAKIAEQNAVYTEQAGEVAAANEGRKGAAKLGVLKVGQATSGVNVNTGTAVNVQAGERETNQLDTETVLANADLKAYGYRTATTGFEAESELAKAKGTQAEEAGYIGATGSLLSAASSVGGKWTGGAPSPSPGVANFNSGNPIY